MVKRLTTTKKNPVRVIYQPSVIHVVTNRPIRTGRFDSQLTALGLNADRPLANTHQTDLQTGDTTHAMLMGKHLITKWL